MNFNLLEMSEEEIFEMWAEIPDIFIDYPYSELSIDSLAELFVKNVVIRDYILESFDNKFELYDIVYDVYKESPGYLKEVKGYGNKYVNELMEKRENMDSKSEEALNYIRNYEKDEIEEDFLIEDSQEKDIKNIDDLIEIQKIAQLNKSTYSEIRENRRKIKILGENYNSENKELTDIKEEVSLLSTKINILLTELNDEYNLSDGIVAEFPDGIVKGTKYEMNNLLEELKEKVNQLRARHREIYKSSSNNEQQSQLESNIDKLMEEFEQREQQINMLLEEKGFDFDFETEKDRFLSEVITTSHISEMEETSEEYFKKLIELYGEEELSSFIYHNVAEIDIPEDDEYEIISDEEAEYYSSIHGNYTIDISDFIFGEEDNLIGLVKNDDLRKRILGSKLKWLEENNNDIDISKFIQDFVDEASKQGIENLVFNDEYGFVNVDETLANLPILPISNDRNFYLKFAKHLDEMNISLDIFIDYIPQNMIDDKFMSELTGVINTGEYSYQTEFSQFSNSNVDKKLLAWLEGKEEELASLEAEEKTISEAEALIDRQNQKQGEQK